MSPTARKKSDAAKSEEPPASVLIWGIDDGPSHLERIQRTFNQIAAPEVVLETWLNGMEAVNVYAARLDAGDLAGLPRVVFMDYFLGEGCNGADLARKMLDYWRARSACAKKAPRPILIGHSSVPDCSALIASIGKSFALEKHSGESVSAAILRVFDTEEKRSYLWKHGMPMSRA